jgi:leader peptidase (prepilin peptidase) / N-methyltransferase
LYMEIPDIVLWSGIAWALVFNLYLDLHIFRIYSIWDSGIFSGVLAAVLAFGFFISLVVLSKEKWMGAGDAYLAILLGLFLGWPKIWLGLVLAFSIGAIYGIILIAMGKKKLKSQVPFAPFMVIGAVLSVVFYQSINLWLDSIVQINFY